MGARYKGYCANVSRSFFINPPKKVCFLSHVRVHVSCSCSCSCSCPCPCLLLTVFLVLRPWAPTSQPLRVEGVCMVCARSTFDVLFLAVAIAASSPPSEYPFCDPLSPSPVWRPALALPRRHTRCRSSAVEEATPALLTVAPCRAAAHPYPHPFAGFSVCFYPPRSRFRTRTARCCHCTTSAWTTSGPGSP